MFKTQMATSCRRTLNITPSPRQTTGTALDRLRCVGHSPIHEEDTIRNATKTVSKDKISSKSMPNAVHFKNSDIILLSVDTRCKEVRPVMPHIKSSCLSLLSTTHWASYSSCDLQHPSTPSQDCTRARRTQGKSDQAEMERKPTIRIRRNSFKPMIPILFQEPNISQCAGITPVLKCENQVKCPEVKIRTPVFRQHYEVMFQEAPWEPLRSSTAVRPLTNPSCRTSKPSSGTQRANLATAPSRTCSTPNTLSGLCMQGTWLCSGEDVDQYTQSGRLKDDKLVTAEVVSEGGDDSKWEHEQTWESHLVCRNESAAGSTRWDPQQFKVTVTKINRQSRT